MKPNLGSGTSQAFMKDINELFQRRANRVKVEDRTLSLLFDGSFHQQVSSGKIR
jgi:hypothetical protein